MTDYTLKTYKVQMTDGTLRIIQAERLSQRSNEYALFGESKGPEVYEFWQKFGIVASFRKEDVREIMMIEENVET